MDTDDLKLRYYRSVVIQTRRGKGRDGVSNAKPIFLLSLFELIEQKMILDNKVLFEDSFKSKYEQLFAENEPQSVITPFFKPFYYLQTDGYWHIQWKDAAIQKCPSAKYLRENIEYASLDNALWDLLQDSKSREILRKTIVNHFFKQRENA